MSLNQYYYAKTLVKRKKIKIYLITEKAVFFEVKSKEKTYEVYYNKYELKWNCTCVFSSAFSKNRDCCHIKACKLLLGKYGKESK
jgi:hypothetical protein